MKRQRASNMIPAERDLLADLCVKYAAQVKSKQTDGVSRASREAASSEKIMLVCA
jgi:hypothetical protein